VKILIDNFIKKTLTSQPAVRHRTERGVVFNPISLVGPPGSVPF